jgi:excisionase family DNA binding protein
MNELPLVLTVEEAAKALRVSRGSAYEAIRCGDIPSVRIGRTIRVPRHGLAVFLGEQDPQREDAPKGGESPGASRTHKP